MFIIQKMVGRLVETRPFALKTPDDVAAFGAKMRELGSSIEGNFVICGDYRKVNVLPPAVSEAFVAMLARTNPRIERSGIVLAVEHAMFNLQVERLVREAGNTARQTFREPTQAEAWLGEVLTDVEKARLHAFLAEG